VIVYGLAATVGRESLGGYAMRLRDIVTERKETGSYRPDDLFPFPEAVANVREWFRRSALRDGLDPEAADEAASRAVLAWMERDYSNGQVARGDHPRALFGTRKFMRRSAWMGGSEYRRSRQRVYHPFTGSEASRTASPVAILAAVDAAERNGLTYVPARERWARRGYRKVGRGAAARWEPTGRKGHREVRRSRILARKVIEAAAAHGGLLAVFTG
jgi:hypothetical protein